MTEGGNCGILTFPRALPFPSQYLLIFLLGASWKYVNKGDKSENIYPLSIYTCLPVTWLVHVRSSNVERTLNQFSMCPTFVLPCTRTVMSVNRSLIARYVSSIPVICFKRFIHRSQEPLAAAGTTFNGYQWTVLCDNYLHLWHVRLCYPVGCGLCYTCTNLTQISAYLWEKMRINKISNEEIITLFAQFRH